MNLITTYIIFQILIILPFICAYKMKNKFSGDISKKLVSLNLIFFEPPIVLWTIWGLDISADMIWLPVSAMCIVTFGMLAGNITSSVTKMQGTTKTAFNISASLANHGFTMGGFICYMLLGEKGLGMTSIFTSYFMAYIFLVIFPYAGMSSGKKEKNTLREFAVNIRNMPFYALLAGLALHIMNIQRPQINFPINYILMVSVIIYYFTLGLTFNIKSIKGTKKENLYLALIKFLIIPAAITGIVINTNITAALKTVIIIESFMPAAIYSVVSAVLFDLDTELASGLFVVNTILFLLFIFPLIIIFKDIFRLL